MKFLIVKCLKKNYFLFSSRNYHKFRFYSAHDSTLNALLVAFDLIDEKNHSWPPFAANLIIELWKNADLDYSVKLIYCGQVT